MNNHDLTFAVQGIYSEHTIPCVESIRRCFPGSPIHFACDRQFSEQGTDLVVKGLVDVLSLYNEPGALYGLWRHHEAVVNLNRQLTGWKAVLRDVDTEYVCQVRADIEFSDPNLPALWENHCRETESLYPNVYSVFSKKIMVPAIYTIDPLQSHKLPFHPGDWLKFGRSQDICALYEVVQFAHPTQVEQEDGKLNFRSEQYPFVEWLKFADRDPNLRWDTDDKYVGNYRSIPWLIHNYLVKNLSTLGIKCLKHPWATEFIGCITEDLYGSYLSKL